MEEFTAMHSLVSKAKLSILTFTVLLRYPILAYKMTLDVYLILLISREGFPAVLTYVRPVFVIDSIVFNDFLQISMCNIFRHYSLRLLWTVHV